MATTTRNARRVEVFRSVFPESVHTPPTDRDTVQPHIQGHEPFQSPRKYNTRQANTPSFRPAVPAQTPSRDQLIWQKTWNESTHFFSSLLVEFSRFLDENISDTGGFQLYSPSAAVQAALTKLKALEEKEEPHSTYKLFPWYQEQSRHHFITHVLPHLQSIPPTFDYNRLLGIAVQILEEAHRVYFHGLSYVLEDCAQGTDDLLAKKFRQEFHTLIEASIFSRIQAPLSFLISERVSAVLSPVEAKGVLKASAVEDARSNLLVGIRALNNIGLGGEMFELILSEVMSDAMSRHIYDTFSQQWEIPDLSSSHRNIRESLHARDKSAGYIRQDQASSREEESVLPYAVNHTTPSQCIWDLCKWIESSYAQLVLEVLQVLHESSSTWQDIEKWKEMSIGRLARLRTSELFEITKSWPNTTGALDDLRASINTPQKRLYLTDSFSTHLERKLLHPATSTLQILRTYIAMIRSFHSLDHSKVLLDRVSYPLQMYLSSRQDAVKIIISGLLSDIEDIGGDEIPDGGDTLVELAKLLNDGMNNTEPTANDQLDWDDLDWQPDPVDAGPGYRRTKSADVIGTLIGVLASPDVFIREFQSIIGENLLGQAEDFGKELKVLDLLKTRFGEVSLQNCEVMVRDILTSRDLGRTIRQKQGIDSALQDIHTTAGERKIPSLYAKVLSRLYWPELPKDSYSVPAEINVLQKQYESRFEAFKRNRKLTWLPMLGRAEVELEFDDRTVVQECFTWQATVIYAFQDAGASGSPARRSVQQLESITHLTESLVRSALRYWESKLVLKQTGVDTYTVLEVLSNDDHQTSNNGASTRPGPSTISTVDNANVLGGTSMGLTAEVGVSAEKKALFWKYIEGMLKNNPGGMPPTQISNMLKMFLPDETISKDDLKALLGDMVRDEKVETKGSKFKLVKK